MADQLPPVNLTYDADQNPTVMIGADSFAGWPDVVAAVVGLDAPENAVPVARMLTHFSYRSRYRVIVDPAAYAADFRARINAEAPDAPFEQNVIRARAFGVPDFATIKPPQMTEGRLVFFVNDTALNVPYRVEALPQNPDLSTQVYTLLPLSPA